MQLLCCIYLNFSLRQLENNLHLIEPAALQSHSLLGFLLRWLVKTSVISQNMFVHRVKTFLNGTDGSGFSATLVLVLVTCPLTGHPQSSAETLFHRLTTVSSIHRPFVMSQKAPQHLSQASDTTRQPGVGSAHWNHHVFVPLQHVEGSTKHRY